MCPQLADNRCSDNGVFIVFSPSITADCIVNSRELSSADQRPELNTRNASYMGRGVIISLPS